MYLSTLPLGEVIWRLGPRSSSVRPTNSRFNSVAPYLNDGRSLSRWWCGFNVLEYRVGAVTYHRTRDRGRTAYPVVDSADISANVAGYLRSPAARAWSELV